MKRTVIVLIVFVILVLLSVWLLGCQCAAGVGQAVEGLGRDVQWMSKQVQEGDR